jgi:quercetin dioxygenase-like cupin family protein
MIRFANLHLAYDVVAMQNELSSFDAEWQLHFNQHYYEGSWTVLPLRSPRGDDKNIIPDLLADSAYVDTRNMNAFSSVSKLILELKCEVMSVRFLNLEAGAIIKQHKDNELAFEKGEARLHFPVLTNPDVEFYIEDKRIAMEEGSCWYINANLPHRVSNNGKTDRIHLVIDCKVNDWLSQLINGSTIISFKDDIDQEELRLMIGQLRLQNTETANQMASKLELGLK